MTHAAGIIGHILVRDWIGARHPACADGHHDAPPAQPPEKSRRREWQGWARNRRTLSWPTYVASVRQMSAGLSRRVAFRRQR
ncbi:hypothetical protein ACMAUO_13875 [Gluconacetobacter sp. Hr-1-5]|uniref:hypothetical protein n=1 Tax=Gluconacetobacter sp. Hr-1-5 TaxID=3395370 RepID=UPI003B5192D1